MKQKDRSPKLFSDDLDWIAVLKRDREAAREMIEYLAGALLINAELSRTERLGLASALISQLDEPEAFFNPRRSGPKPEKTLEKICIWQAVTERKRQLKSEGRKVVDAIGDVAENLGYSEAKVKKGFDEIQNHIKRLKTMNQGIASLL